MRFKIGEISFIYIDIVNIYIALNRIYERVL